MCADNVQILSNKFLMLVKRDPVTAFDELSRKPNPTLKTKSAALNFNGVLNSVIKIAMTSKGLGIYNS